MPHIFHSFDPKAWERFCELILIREYGRRHVYTVPDEDNGDHGIEFFTTAGTIFQCYIPKKQYSLAEYKRKIQTKINEDLNKLKTYATGISELLGETVVDEWVLLTPELLSKDLIKYCRKKENQVKKQNLPFINKVNFVVKIETPDRFPGGYKYALTNQDEVIHVEVPEVEKSDCDLWKAGNAEFLDNILRKEKAVFTSAKRARLDNFIKNYLQLDELLSTYRDEFPDLLSEVIAHASSSLSEKADEFLIGENPGQPYLVNVTQSNKIKFQNISKKISPNNIQVLSSGFIAKWLAECNMDFLLDDEN